MSWSLLSNEGGQGCSALPVGQRVDVCGEEPLGGDRRGGVPPRGHLEHPLRVEARGSAGGDPVTEDLRRDLGMELKAEMAAGQERLRPTWSRARRRARDGSRITSSCQASHGPDEIQPGLEVDSQSQP